MLRLRLLILGLLIAIHCFCQSNGINFNASHGLCSDVIYDIQPDCLGQLWLGTDNGVSRYDGKVFKNYSIDDGLSDNEVFQIFPDSKGRIWFLTYNGELSYWFDGTIFNATSTPILAQIKSESYFYKAQELANGDLLFQTWRDGFYQLTEAGKVHHFFPKKPCRIIPFNNAFLLLVGPVANEQVQAYRFKEQPDTTSSSLFTWKAFTDRVESFNHHLIVPSGIRDGSQTINIRLFDLSTNVPELVYALETHKKTCSFLLLEEDKETFAIGVGNELWRFKVEDNAIAVETQTTYENVPSDYVYDFEGGLWVSTLGSGIYYAPSYPYKKLEDPTISTMIKQEDRVWIGYKGRIDCRSIATLDTLHSIKLPLDELVTNIYTLHPDSLIISTETQAMLIVGGEIVGTINVVAVKDIIATEDVVYFIGAQGIEKFKRNNLLHHPPEHIYRRRVLNAYPYEKQLYFGTNQGLYNLEEPGKRIEGPSSRINTILPFNTQLLISTNKEGIYYLNEKQLKRIDFPAQEINALHKINDSLLAIFTPKIIYIASVSIQQSRITLAIQQKIINEGFNQLIATEGGYLISSKHGLYFEEDKDAVAPSPRITLDRIKAESREIYRKSQADVFEVPYAKGIEIYYRAIALSDQKNITYRYKVNNHDWAYTQSNLIAFHRLEQEENEIQIQALSAYGSASNILRIPIHQMVPLYYTRTFWACIALCFALLMAIWFIKWRNRMRDKWHLEHQLLLSRQRAFRSQMNPHFIFNALNAIQNLFMSGRIEEAQKYMNKFSEILRANLSVSEMQFIALVDEVKFIQQYLDIECLRIAKKFEYHINIGSEVDLDNDLFPSMMIQPFVENAIWHGIDGINGGKVEFNIYKEDGVIECQVIDNGVGFYTAQKNSKSGHKSMALEIIKMRIELINRQHDINLSLTIEQRTPGTKVSLKMNQDV